MQYGATVKNSENNLKNSVHTVCVSEEILTGLHQNKQAQGSEYEQNF